VLEEPRAAKGLEVPVLDPSRADRVVRKTLDVPEDVQPRHQPRGQAGPADLVDEGLAADGVEPRPVDPPAKLQQLVPGVEDRLEGLAEHFRLLGIVWLGGEHRHGLHPVSRGAVEKVAGY
jgi:hypothetical protein